MLKLLVFHLRNFFMRKSTYICIILPILVLSLITYTSNILFPPRTYGFLFVPNLVWYTVMFFSSIIFVIIQIISIFKKAEDDGTSLFLLSKPISRLRQILSQLVILLISIVFFSLSIFMVGIIVGLLDEATNKTELIKFAFSILIANIIIMSIFGSLVLLTSIWVSSTGMIAIWSIIIFSLPSFSAVLSPFVTESFTMAKNFSFMPVTTEVEKAGKDTKPTLNTNDVVNFDYTKKDSVQQKNWNSYIDKSKNWTRWMDPYAQLRDLYYSFSNSNNTSGQKWIQESSIAVKRPNDWILKNNNIEYLLLWKSTNNSVAGEGDDPSKFYSTMFNFIIDSSALSNEIKKVNNSALAIDKYDFGQQMTFADTIFKAVSGPIATTNVEMMVKNAMAFADIAALTHDYFTNSTWYDLASLYFWDSQGIINLNLNSNIDMSKFIYNPTANTSNQELVFLQVGQNYNKFIEESIISKKYLIPIWLSIFVVATILPSYLYIKKKN